MSPSLLIPSASDLAGWGAVAIASMAFIGLGRLWSAAVQVARRDGVNQTAAALHLDGGKLKRRMVATGPVPDKTRPPAFVEMLVIWLEIVQTGSEARTLATTFLEHLRNDDSVVVMLLIARWR